MDETAVLAPEAHRGIRLLDPRESAYPGELITDGERRAVRVPAESVPEVLWGFAGAEHVAGVRDVLRRSDGHDALLPWCADRVEAFLGRRAVGETGLSMGETVTLVGSMLRGIGEVGDRAVAGQWWLTDDARPLFAPGEGAGCSESAVALIARLREGCADRAMDRLLARVATAAGDPRVVRRSLEQWERELTDLAAPKPLLREAFAPERVAAIEAHLVRLPGDAQSLAAPRDRLRQAGQRAFELAMRLRETIGDRRARRGHVDAPVADRVSATPARAGRGRMLLAGGAAAGVVLIGGLLWPSSEQDSSASERVADEASVDQGTQDASAESGTSEGPLTQEHAHPSSAPEGDAVTDGSAQQHAAVLLAAIADCADQGDAACADSVVGGAGALVQERLAGAGEGRTITAVEDYGDVSVLRLGASGQRGEQMLVLVAHEDGWLVRDVYDVADQPSDRG